MSKQDQSKAFNEGMDAYFAGLAPHLSPYEEGSQDWSDWVRGWKEADRLDREDAKQHKER